MNKRFCNCCGKRLTEGEIEDNFEADREVCLCYFCAEQTDENYEGRGHELETDEFKTVP